MQSLPIPFHLKRLFETAFEIDSSWSIKAAAHRQKWIDQSQSLNIHLEKPSGKELSRLYEMAYDCGLKTTYYLRTKGATRVAPADVSHDVVSCNIDGNCESCQ